MTILQLASEAVPFAKTGGLGDVVSALARHLVSRGHRTPVFLPLYRSVREAGHDPSETVLRLPPGVASRFEASICCLPGPPEEGEVYFVDVPELFDREGLYGAGGRDHPDNAERFAAFVRASLAAAGLLELEPDVAHCHDWQTALAPVYLRTGRAPEGADPSLPTVLTIHNLAYQGIFEPEALAQAGLPESLLAPEALGFHGRVNLLRGGLRYADRVTTVSPTYAREITTPELGFGLESVLAELDPPVLGILNGIDTRTWDPATDPLLPARFGPENLAGKAECKRALQEEFGLPQGDSVPLFGQVTRLVEQKGIGLIEALGEDLGALQAQFVFVGLGEERFERFLAGLAERLPNVRFRVAFSEPLAHLLEAGSDFFLMPSRFEPCGLNQMISQRYGTLPIVHRVGGLADSVVHASPEAIEAGRATGVVFDRFEASELRRAIEAALDLYGRPEDLARIRRAAMAADFSWASSGRRYEELYAEIVAAEVGTGERIRT